MLLVMLYWLGYVTVTLTNSLQCYDDNVLSGTPVCWDLENKQYTGTDKIILLTTNTQLLDPPQNTDKHLSYYSSRNFTLNLSPTPPSGNKNKLNVNSKCSIHLCSPAITGQTSPFQKNILFAVSQTLSQSLYSV